MARLAPGQHGIASGRKTPLRIPPPGIPGGRLDYGLGGGRRECRRRTARPVAARGRHPRLWSGCLPGLYPAPSFRRFRPPVPRRRRDRRGFIGGHRRQPFSHSRWNSAAGWKAFIWAATTFAFFLQTRTTRHWEESLPLPKNGSAAAGARAHFCPWRRACHRSPWLLSFWPVLSGSLTEFPSPDRKRWSSPTGCSRPRRRPDWV